MRFVELRAEEGRPPIRLHPRLTVLQGLDPVARVSFVGFLHSVAMGETLDWNGTLDIHGVEMDLETGLATIGPTAESGLILEASALLADGDGDPLSSGAEAAALADAASAREALEREIADLADELSGAAQVRAEMVARVDRATAALQPAACAELDVRDGRRRRADASTRVDTGLPEDIERVRETETLIAELDEMLASLPSGDRPNLAAAGAAARAAIGSGSVACPEAAALAAALRSLRQRLDGIESRLEAAGGGRAAAATRLEAARRIARVAADAATPRLIDAEELARLDELHEQVVLLEQKAGRGVRRGATLRDFDAAQEALTTALEAFGYPTWAAFRMGNGTVAVADETLAAATQARRELEQAEAEWNDAVAIGESDDDLRAVVAAIEQAFAQAAALLGDETESVRQDIDEEILPGESDGAPSRRTAEEVASMVERLDARTVSADTVVVDRADAMDNLRSRLDEAGALGHREIASEAGLVGLAETWLAVLDAADVAAVRLLRDRDRAGHALASFQEPSEGSGYRAAPPEDPPMAEIEGAVAQHRQALLDRHRALLELHMLLATELAVAEEHDEKIELLTAARSLEAAAAAALDAAADGTAAIAEIAGRVPRGTGGALPIIVLMGGAPVRALDALDDLPDDVQIIVIGDSSAMASWVAAKGVDEVTVIDSAPV